MQTSHHRPQHPYRLPRQQQVELPLPLPLPWQQRSHLQVHRVILMLHSITQLLLQHLYLQVHKWDIRMQIWQPNIISNRSTCLPRCHQFHHHIAVPSTWPHRHLRQAMHHPLLPGLVELLGNAWLRHHLQSRKLQRNHKHNIRRKHHQHYQFLYQYQPLIMHSSHAHIHQCLLRALHLRNYLLELY